MLLLCLLLACFQTPAPAAPAEARAVEVWPKWNVGALLSLELVKGREDWEDEQLQKSSKTVTPIDVRIMAKSQTGSIMRWTYGHTSIVEGAGPDKDFAEHMASLNEGMRVDARLATSGLVEGLADPNSLQRHYSKMLQELEKGLVEKGTDQRVIDAVIADATKRVLGPDFDKAALAEIVMFENYRSEPLIPGKKIEREDRLPNPIGGDPFPALGTWEVEPLDPAKHEVTLHYNVKIDPQKTRELIHAWLTEVAKQAGKEPPKDTDELPLKGLDENTTYVIDTDTGLPIRVEHVRTTLIKKHRRIDRLFLRAVTTPAQKPSTDGAPR
ncbi:MAG: hypothetical protein IPJ19_15680 [Planctomycetes bacterium]|nr:hypothetical protein [Planctomycetota bacterium]